MANSTTPRRSTPAQGTPSKVPKKIMSQGDRDAAELMVEVEEE